MKETPCNLYKGYKEFLLSFELFICEAIFLVIVELKLFEPVNNMYKLAKIFSSHNKAKIVASFFSGFANLLYFIEKGNIIKVKIVPDKQQ
jgi:hypothetical protein